MLHLKTILMAHLYSALLEITPDPKMSVWGRWIHFPPFSLASSFDGRGDLLTLCRVFQVARLGCKRLNSPNGVELGKSIALA